MLTNKKVVLERVYCLHFPDRKIWMFSTFWQSWNLILYAIKLGISYMLFQFFHYRISFDQLTKMLNGWKRSLKLNLSWIRISNIKLF